MDRRERSWFSFKEPKICLEFTSVSEELQSDAVLNGKGSYDPAFSAGFSRRETPM